MTTDKPYLSVDDLAAKLQIPKQTIYAWRSEFPKRGPRGFRVGRHLRFRPEDVEEWVQSLLDGDDRRP